jgi:opacity protein-like surface antigen
MQRFVAVLTVAACLGFANAANAQFYVGLHGGANFAADSKMEDPVFSGFGVDAEARFDPGFAVGAFAGYRFDLQQGVSFDLEAEATYRQNGLDELGLSVGGSSASTDFNDGDVSSLGGFINGWINWRLGESNVVPYFGGGIGAVHISIDDAETDILAFEDEDDLVFGGQVGAGVAYEFTENVAVSLDYRFMMTQDPEFDTTEGEYQNHSVMIGLKYLF